MTPPDPLPILAEVGTLATAAADAVHRVACPARARRQRRCAPRCATGPGPGLTRAGATLRSVADGLAALLEGEPRAALDHLLEALPGLPALGGSRAQQEVVLETALAAMLRLGAPGQAARLLSRHRSAPAVGIQRGAVS